jgi:hypothetical protein
MGTNALAYFALASQTKKKVLQQCHQITCLENDIYTQPGKYIEPFFYLILQDIRYRSYKTFYGRNLQIFIVS